MKKIYKLSGILVMTAMLAACSDSDSDDNDDAQADEDSGTYLAINDCSLAEAEDLTGNAAVTVTETLVNYANSSWRVPHQVCIEVDAGTTVTWEGNFNFHPLAGGSPGAADALSPITAATPPESGSGTIDVTLNDAGTYGYYCTTHGASMQGVIYVR